RRPGSAIPCTSRRQGRMGCAQSAAAFRDGDTQPRARRSLFRLALKGGGRERPTPRAGGGTPSLANQKCHGPQQRATQAGAEHHSRKSKLPSFAAHRANATKTRRPAMARESGRSTPQARKATLESSHTADRLPHASRLALARTRAPNVRGSRLVFG